MFRRIIFLLLLALVAATSSAQPASRGQVSGCVTDETGGVLVGVAVELRPHSDTGVRSRSSNVVNAQGGYRLSNGLRATLDVFNVQQPGERHRLLLRVQAAR